MSPEHRYELKFIIDAETKNELLRLAEPGLMPDPHGEQGLYRVSSQYFDTRDFQGYWEKLDGVGYRRKFRLRYYGEGESGAFFEIKHRYDQTVYKERVPLLEESWKELIAGEASLGCLEAYVPELEGAQRRTLTQIVLAANQRPLLGASIISYLRQAWVGRYDQRLRVTFDHLVRAFPAGDHTVPWEQHGAACLPDSRILLEVKFNDRLPVWLRDCICQVAVQPIRFSKYATGMDALSERASTALTL